MLRIDLTLSRFGMWKVLSYGETRNGNAYWHCQCDCGTVKLVNGLSLRDGRSTSCGCLRIDHAQVDHTGKRFGFLEVVGRAGTRPSKSGNRLRWATPKEQVANRRPFKVGRITSFSDAELTAELARRETTNHTQGSLQCK